MGEMWGRYARLLELAVGVAVGAALVRVDGAREGDVVDVAVGLVRELADEDVQVLVARLEAEAREARLLRVRGPG